ncbi:hypothetical protein [Tunicatimonas pelagia]|uniref:hypothetical protein n=1 Tax=Tunicatimonas pelagia TaxID=931531 RepID=UPI0026653032|nr:hypothetical protein [Tunicatimonas pelagia]WKN44252.1 hypothetical protein P0M28_04650 [Tunicatimonas pelagia]
MKSYRIALTILLASSLTVAFTRVCYAQKVIKVEDRALKDSLGENAKRNTRQLGYLLLLRRMSKNTRDDVEATGELQYRYREFLRQTHSTASLAVADTEAAREALTWTVGTAGHLGKYSFASNLHRTYAEQSLPLEKSEALSQQLVPYDESLLFTQLASFQRDQHLRQLNAIALQEMSARRKLQLAQAYQQFANGKIAKSDELRKLLNTDASFSMTESERLEVLGRMQDYLISSQQLQEKADALIQQTGDYPFSKRQVLNSFRQAQKRRVLRGTPLF